MATIVGLHKFLRFGLHCSVFLANIPNLDCLLMAPAFSAEAQPYAEMLNDSSREWDLSCAGLWMGNGPKHTTISDKPILVDVVVAYCDYSLSWLSTELSNLPSFISVRQVSVYSKCGKPVVGAPDGFSLTALENVGVCDHAYAYHNAKFCSSRESGRRGGGGRWRCWCSSFWKS
eukprot:TRINITY_DN6876_c0_g1_i3.p1 TRINITY_DN6876_c0_g1~~TRINITY_DN6876_c0_g1_i3.p1  ORF type:complete len:174 (-),score=2.65 TRINITY_DN6876_c0_g1_i3:65-586(-)